MPNPLNVPITPPRVAFIDPRTGNVSREWYMFFLSLFQSQGGSSVSLDDVQKGPPALTVDEINDVVAKASENLRPSTESVVEQIAELRKQIDALELQVRPELGTLSAIQQDNVPWLQFDTTPDGYPTGPQANGTVYWDDADSIKTLNIVMEDSGEVVQHVGEETYYRVKATVPITNGQVVMFAGTVGASGGLLGAPATGLTATQNEYIMGVATQDIVKNGWGYVTWFGEVKKINTTGGAEAWVDGQILYYNPAVPGGLTKFVPAAPNPKVIVASVVHAATNGILFVRPTFGSALGATDSNVEISGLANGDLLQYDSAQQRWENVPASTLPVGTATNIAGGAAGSVPYQSAPSTTAFRAIGTAGQVFRVNSGATAPEWVSPAALTKTDDTNVTLTLGGNPTNALLAAASLTLGWTGQLAVARGGSGASTAADARTNFGATTVGSNLFTLANPSAVTYMRINADNSVSTLDAATFRTAIGAGTGNGTVTSVATGTGLTGGPITTSGTISFSVAAVGTWAATPSSANLAAAMTDETGSGSLVFATRPSFASTIGVGGATASASGAGVTFPATQSPSTDPNTLDDYEEGTWTATYGASGSNTGQYIKIGNLVFIDIVLTSTSQTFSQINGLPFSSSTGSGYAGGTWGRCFNANIFDANGVPCRMGVNSTYIELRANVTNLPDPSFNVTTTTGTVRLGLSAVYRTT